MSINLGSNDWNHHVALIVHLPVDQALVQQVNNGAFTYLNDGAVQMTISNLQKMFGQQLKVKKIQTFKTPFSQLQLTSLIGYHEYAVIQTQSDSQKIYWSTEKNGERIWLSAFNTFEQCRDLAPTKQKRCKVQYWKPQLKRQGSNYYQDLQFYDIVRWIYQESRNKKGYGFFQQQQQNLYFQFIRKIQMIRIQTNS